jgi:hypothetical protein
LDLDLPRSTTCNFNDNLHSRGTLRAAGDPEGEEEHRGGPFGPNMRDGSSHEERVPHSGVILWDGLSHEGMHVIMYGGHSCGWVILWGKNLTC